MSSGARLKNKTSKVTWYSATTRLNPWRSAQNLPDANTAPEAEENGYTRAGKSKQKKKRRQGKGQGEGGHAGSCIFSLVVEQGVLEEKHPSKTP